MVDVCGGHGLLAAAMLVLDDTSPEAIVVDRALPPSSAKLREVLEAEWPRLHGRLLFLEQEMNSLQLRSNDLVVSVHACGALTDRIIERAVAARARLAVLPCCHDFGVCDAGGLAGWVDRALAIDITRATTLRHNGYRVWTQAIANDITSKNRLLIGAPIEPVRQ